jgi:hypothetical protein
LLAFEDNELLAKSGGLQPEAVSRDKEWAEVGGCREHEPDHHYDVNDTACRRLLETS